MNSIELSPEHQSNEPKVEDLISQIRTLQRNLLDHNINPKDFIPLQDAEKTLYRFDKSHQSPDEIEEVLAMRATLILFTIWVISVISSLESSDLDKIVYFVDVIPNVILSASVAVTALVEVVLYKNMNDRFHVTKIKELRDKLEAMSNKISET